MRKLIKLAMVSALGLLYLGAGGTAKADDSWDSLVAAAKKEGSVTFYSASVGSVDNLAVTDAFTKQYGIKVQRLEARSPELLERLRTELATGHESADVLYVSTEELDKLEPKNELAPFGTLPASGGLKPEFHADSMILPTVVIPYGLVINTQLVSDADAPKSWRDIIDPKWKGKILMDDPRDPGAGSTFFTVARNNFGQDFLQKMKANDITLTRDNHEAGLRVAQGEFAMFFPMSTNDAVKLKGLPIRAYAPQEGETYITFGLSLVQHAAHPNAARLLMNYFLSPLSAKAFAENGRGVTFKGDPASDNADSTGFASGKLWGTEKTSGETADLAKQIFGN